MLRSAGLTANRNKMSENPRVDLGQVGRPVAAAKIERGCSGCPSRNFRVSPFNRTWLLRLSLL